jgi:hypothetical protein
MRCTGLAEIKRIVDVCFHKIRQSGFGYRIAPACASSKVPDRSGPTDIHGRAGRW